MNLVNHDEIYLYIGSRNNVFFFFHLIDNKLQFNQSISKKIYEICIASNLIYDSEQSIIIYECDDTSTDLFYITSIQHLGKEIFNKYDIDDLNNLFVTLLNEQKNNIAELYAIKYIYANQSYYTYNLSPMLQIIPNIPDGPIKFSKIIEDYTNYGMN